MALLIWQFSKKAVHMYLLLLFISSRVLGAKFDKNLCLQNASHHLDQKNHSRFGGAIRLLLVALGVLKLIFCDQGEFSLL